MVPKPKGNGPDSDEAPEGEDAADLALQTDPETEGKSPDE